MAFGKVLIHISLLDHEVWSGLGRTGRVEARRTVGAISVIRKGGDHLELMG